MARINYSGARDRTIDVSERNRPAMVRHAAHESRESDDREDDVHQDYDPNKWINPSSLSAPPPRAGFVQRWVVDGTTPNSPNERSYQKKWREGYRPRDPSTIPAHLRDVYPSSKAGNGADMIRVAGLILMELPRQAAMQRYNAVNDSVKRQLKAIPESTQELRRRARESEGVGDLQVTDGINSVRGRRAATMVE